MFQHGKGRHTTQGHKGIPEGHFEEEQGRKGFFGPVSHLIKPQPSTRWTSIEGPLRPHLYDAVQLPKKFGHWQRMFFNVDITLSFWHEAKMQGPARAAFRNADADTLYFVHQGSGHVLTEFGVLNFSPGHYLLLPKCATHSFVCQTDATFLVIESHGSAFREPDRGMVGRNAFYDPAAFGIPNLEELMALRSQREITRITVKRDGEFTHFDYTEDVFDTVGWKGDFFPVSLHIRDLMPMLSARVHLPPSAHTTFVAHNFVV
ncbi:MAG: homogentisate 1,2-dioxygenase, partial [Bdellovibrio sp.]